MAINWSTSPPRWLEEIAKPIDAKGTGQLLGTLLSGATKSIANAGKEDTDPTKENKSFFDYYAESRMTQADPLWREKLAVVQSRNALQQYTLKTKLEAGAEVSRWQAEAMKKDDWYNHPSTTTNPEAQRIISGMQNQGRQSAAAKAASAAAVATVKSDAETSEMFANGMASLSDPITRREIQNLNPKGGQPTVDQLAALGKALRNEGRPVPWEKSTSGATLEKLQEGRRRAVTIGDTAAIAQFDKEIQQLNESKPASNVGKIISDRQEAIDAGAPPEVIKWYDDSLKKASTSGTQIRERELEKMAEEHRAKGDIEYADKLMRLIVEGRAGNPTEIQKRQLETDAIKRINKLSSDLAGLRNARKPDLNKIAVAEGALNDYRRSLNVLRSMSTAPALPVPSTNAPPQESPTIINPKSAVEDLRQWQKEKGLQPYRNP